MVCAVWRARPAAEIAWEIGASSELMLRPAPGKGAGSDRGAGHGKVGQACGLWASHVGSVGCSVAWRGGGWAEAQRPGANASERKAEPWSRVWRRDGVG